MRNNMARRTVLVASVGMIALVAFPLLARADDCPAGSRLKSEAGFSWCEPSVCQNDGNCSPSEVCRPVPLCVQVGKLDEQASTKDAAQKLVATQRCAPDKTCPATTTCSDMTRCVSKADAEKMGMSSPPAASAASPAAETKKSSCGCTVAGGPGESRLGLGALAAIGLAVGSRRIQRRARRDATRTN